MNSFPEKITRHFFLLHACYRNVVSLGPCIQLKNRVDLSTLIAEVWSFMLVNFCVIISGTKMQNDYTRLIITSPSPEETYMVWQLPVATSVS